MKETPYELLKDNEKKKLGKNEEAKMTIYNALPRKEYERVFMCKTAKEVWHTLIITHQGNSQVKNCMIDLLTQEYEKFSISNKETIDSGFTRFNAIATSLKSLDPDYSNINEEEAEAFNLLARNFRKGNRFRRGNRFGNRANRFGKGHGNSFGNKGGESSRPKEACYSFIIEGHFASECRNLKENKTDSEDGDEQPNDATCLMAIDSQENFTKTFEKLLKEKRALEDKNSKLLSKINDLEIEVNKLANKEVVEPCLKYVELTQEADSLTSNVSKLQDEALKFSKFKSSSIALDDMLSRQKLSQDREGDWIVDSGCTKHMTGNRRLFTSYKAYDGGCSIWSNLKANVIGGGNITHDSITITNVEHVGGLAFNLISVDNSTLWHRRLGPYLFKGVEVVFVESKDDVLEKFKILCKRLKNLHDCSIVSIITNHGSEFDKFHFGSFCEQHGISYNLSDLFTSQSNDVESRTHCKELPKPKLSSSVEEARINKPIVQDLNGSLSLQINVSDEGYPKSLKEARGYPIEQVIGELNARTLR
ncbi:zf-CCHC domain-containing protein [Tanacetum coccineum]